MTEQPTWKGQRGITGGSQDMKIIGGFAFMAVGACILLSDARVRAYLRGLDMPGLLRVAAPETARYFRVGQA